MMTGRLLLTDISHNAAHDADSLNSVGDHMRRIRSSSNGILVFEGETKLFNDRVGQNFTRNALHFGFALLRGECRH